MASDDKEFPIGLVRCAECANSIPDHVNPTGLMACNVEDPEGARMKRLSRWPHKKESRVVWESAWVGLPLWPDAFRVCCNYIPKQGVIDD